MVKKKTYDSYIDDNVVGESQSITEFDIVPVNKIAKVLNFSGYDTLIDGISGIIALQFGSGSDWVTIRAGGNGYFDYAINKDYVGDGVKKFRIVRTNKSKNDKEMFAWVDIVVL